MSERPFMQLYVSDFLGDTLHLSTEQIGAYMLLLMAMWNAGGSLPYDATKLARVTRLSLKRWQGAAPDLMEFFEVAGGLITHHRLTRELQKSESKSRLRASAGAHGGRSKSLKNKEAGMANATGLLKHLPDTRSQKEKEPLAQQPVAARAAALPSDWLERCLAANGMGTGFRDERHVGLLNPAPLIGLTEAGFDFDRDVLPGIAAKPNPRARTWGYFDGQIRDFAARRDKAAAIPKPEPKAIDWPGRLRVWRDGGTWAVAWGPRPGESGCGVPAELMTQAGQEAA